MPVKLYFIYLSLLFIGFSCGGAPENRDFTSTLESDSAQSDIPQSYKMPTLDQVNAREHLLAYGEVNLENRVDLHTEEGIIKIKLYEDTPLHRASFVYLSKKGFFNGVPFYRIMPKFMVQAGASNFPQRKAAKEKLGIYKIPSEYNTDQYFHKRGALSMTKPDNASPKEGSTPYDFFIVQGQKLSPGQLQSLAQSENMVFSAAQKTAYTSVGGAPALDNKHTVFGEVLEGMEIVDKIATQKVRPEDNFPLEPLVIKKVEVYRATE